TLIEKRSTGTTKIYYHYDQDNSQDELKKVEITSYEGIQNVKSSAIITRSIRDGYSLPTKMQIKSTQNLIKKGVGNYTRELSETFHFKNYQINKAKAVLYFSKK
ncbi:MAG: hypothetical protein KC478_15770, partial [Bacteriovoracaceae bacterium]|nr:hypothetical protein [Bacteriovoracaceae bacterium]